MRSILATIAAGVTLLAACEHQALAPPERDAAALAASVVLAAPSGAWAAATSATQVTVGWNDNSVQETRFEVHRSTASGAYGLVATRPGNATSYNDGGLQEATGYCYRIRAVRVMGRNTVYSEFSNAACATTALTAPSGLTATALSTSQINLAWQDNSASETLFEVQRAWSGDGIFGMVGTVPAGATAYSDLGLPYATGFCYRVRAVRNDGGQVIASAFSNHGCATTASGPPQPAYSTVAVPQSSSAVSVGWQADQSAPFRIERSLDGGASWQVAGTVTAGYTYFTDLGLQSDRDVCYRVIAYTSGGEAAPSNTDCTAPPAAPSGFWAATVDAQTIELRWSDNSAVEDGYEIWLDIYTTSCCPDGGACDAGAYYDQYLVAELPANATSFQTAGVLGGDQQCYGAWYTLFAIKDGGYSDAIHFTLDP